MTSTQRIAIFGATGGTGRELVTQALAAGLDVTAFVRQPGRLTPHRRLREVVGDVTEPDRVAAAVAGQDAVLVALGAGAYSKARVREVGHRAIVDAMQAAGVRRIVSLSVLGILDSESLLTPFLRYVVRAAVPAARLR